MITPATKLPEENWKGSLPSIDCKAGSSFYLSNPKIQPIVPDDVTTTLLTQKLITMLLRGQNRKTKRTKPKYSQMHVNEFSLQKCQHSHTVMSQFPPANKDGCCRAFLFQFINTKFEFLKSFRLLMIGSFVSSIYFRPSGSLLNWNHHERAREEHGVCAERLFSFLEHISDVGVKGRYGSMAKVIHVSVFIAGWLTNRIWQRWV